MEKFVGRKAELKHLEDLYEHNVQTCCVYGRRRVGKSTLLDEFCKDKDSLTIPFVEKTESANVELINRILSDKFRKEFDIRSLGGFIDEFPRLFGGKAVIVFDEFSYIADAAPYFPSLLQHFIDRVLPKTELMLIICGSSVSSMTSEIDDSERPLFGRFSDRMEIGSMSYRECREFHPNMTDTDSLKLYMTVGGIPLYHRILNYDTYEECVKNGFIGRYSALSSEAENIVRRELSPYQTYSSMITAMTSGSVTIKEISEKVGISPSLCSRYMKNLRMLNIAEKINPMGNSPKEPRFAICDNLIGFYYKVIEANKWITDTENRDFAYEKITHPTDTFLGMAFERLCREYIAEKYVCKEIGTWWGWSGTDIEEIDIAATVLKDDIEYTLLGECKFRKKPTGPETARKLSYRAGLVKGLANKRLIIFSVSGFDTELEEYAEENGITLVDSKRLYSEEP